MLRRGITGILLVLSGAFRLPAQGTEAPAKADLLRDLSSSLETLARQVNHAVVQITTSGYSIGDDSENGNVGALTRQRATGSGVLLTSDGYIVTNNHVIQGARQIRVQVPPVQRDPSQPRPAQRPKPRVLDAKVVGIDRESDLAVLKVEGTGMPHLVLADSGELRQGQLVMAFGSPLGLEHSVSMGVVSSVARQIHPDDPMVYVQTDAPINPGNSGGPLVDTAGRVVGINTFILSQSGGSEGLGFAVPSNIVNSVYKQLKKDGHFHRGQIGLRARTITPLLSAGLQLPQDWGVLVEDVYPGGPADKAGIQVGDVVQSVNARIMENARQLAVNLYRQPVGDKVKVQVLRGSTQMEFSVPVVEQQGDPLRFADLVDPEKGLVRRLGILGVEIDKRIAELAPDLRKQYGVVVAARAGEGPIGSQIQPGDVIYAFNGRPITSVSALRGALDDLKPGDPVVLQIERDGRLMYLSFEME